MKWLVLSCFLLWARHGEGGALKCLPEDDACSSQLSQQVEQQEMDIRRPTSSDAPAECLSGSEWDSNCHSCRCVAGEAQCVRQSGCHSIEEPIRCKPNTTFERDCNTCRCLENGLGICTIMECASVTTEAAPSKPIIPKGVDCAPGTTWQSQCNECVCSPEGRRYCTDKACPGQETEPLLRCAPQSQWKNDCNMCWCNSGRAMCTKMGCMGIPSEMHFDDRKGAETVEIPEPNQTLIRKTRATPQEPPKNCQPGQEFRMDCNKCLCDNEGQNFSCTRIDCTALNNNNNNGNRRKRDVSQKVSADCVPGSVFEQGCNVCRCTEDGGHATCTLKRCQSKENSTLTATESSFRCNPGEQFKQSCNDCSCSADGKSVFCTLLVCDDELSP
ncbi:cysteine-rich motor neuron 1 protein-like isoform X5 [Cydia pomonella]|uniref:cysteine-rich motor neuron 1 protein-like isoform X5 n=1 Tax=Cydia pomonella TaxID=82600 RepID=UPI002ADD44BB|nr:cysteine-rich motor neuron 1 protein-like isoform X5 [Cydia pomonella]